MADLKETPSGMRTHIGVFGNTNSGKSTLINSLTGQDVSIVSPVSGTTTDPIYKPMELSPIGPCLFIDTAGFSDDSSLGAQRLKKTKKAASECDLAIWIQRDNETPGESTTLQKIIRTDIPIISVINHFSSKNILPENTDSVLHINALTGEGLAALKDRIISIAGQFSERSILGNLVKKSDLILLVMPQDIQAPKGRLILPQVTTLRELLDRHCITMCVSTGEFEKALASLREPPKLIITDSQVFDVVYEKKPEKSALTSFSVLYAGLKGDVGIYIDGACHIASLPNNAKILIAESCSHAPMEEDIGRVKIPAMLKKRIGSDLQFDIVSGKDFPEDVSGYDLIIQCGGCMVGRQQILSRIHFAESQQVPITNYGICIAYLKGILDKIVVAV